jgi:hypothetical protein
LQNKHEKQKTPRRSELGHPCRDCVTAASQKNAEWYQEYVNDTFEQSDCSSNSVNDVLWIYGKHDPAMVEKQLVEKYKQASKYTLSESARCEIICIGTGDHGINSLITDFSKEKLSELL